MSVQNRRVQKLEQSIPQSSGRVHVIRALDSDEAAITAALDQLPIKPGDHVICLRFVPPNSQPPFSRDGVE